MSSDEERGGRRRRRRRDYDYDDDDDDDILDRRRIGKSTVISRCILLLVNALSAAFGGVLVYAGATVLLAQNVDQIGGLDQPIILLVVFGAVLTFLSLCGFLGACCAIQRDGHSKIDGCCADRALMIYYVGILTVCSCLLYAGVLCLMYKGKASEYVDVYWKAITDVLEETPVGKPDPEAIKGHLRDGGVICLIGMVVNILCAHLSARVMGYRHTAKRTMITSNMVALALGVLLIVLAFLPGSREVGPKDGYLPHLIGSLGILATLLAFCGLLGAYFMSACLLSFNGVVLGMLCVAFFGIGIYALTNADQAKELVEGQLAFVKSRVYDLCPDCTLPAEGADDVVIFEFDECCVKMAGLIVWDNMTSLGLGCCILLMSMCVNVFFSFFLWNELRKRRRRDNYRSERGRLRPMRKMRSRRRKNEDSDEGVSSGEEA